MTREKAVVDRNTILWWLQMKILLPAALQAVLSGPRPHL